MQRNIGRVGVDVSYYSFQPLLQPAIPMSSLGEYKLR